MIPITTLLPRLMPHVAGCPRPAAIRALVDSAREFCTMTDVIEVVSDPITVVPGTAEYAVDAGSGMEIVRVLRAWIGRTPLIAVTPENTLAPPNTYSGSPTHFRVSAGSEESNDDVDVALQLLPTPDALSLIHI